MTRIDNRIQTQLRPVRLTVDYLDYAEGSVLIGFGEGFRDSLGGIRLDLRVHAGRIAPRACEDSSHCGRKATSPRISRRRS